MKLGIIREGKTPPDKRVVLTPEQCKHILSHYPNIEIKVQKSEIRKFRDEEYSSLGIPIVDSVEDCDILIGVKEVPINELIPNKKYLFFSHTFKEQPYNRNLLIAVLEKNNFGLNIWAKSPFTNNRLIIHTDGKFTTDHDQTN